MKVLRKTIRVLLVCLVFALFIAGSVFFVRKKWDAFAEAAGIGAAQLETELNQIAANVEAELKVLSDPQMADLLAPASPALEPLELAAPKALSIAPPETQMPALLEPSYPAVEPLELIAPAAPIEKQVAPLLEMPPSPLPPLPSAAPCSYAFFPQLITVRHIEGITDQEGLFPLATNYSTLTVQLAPPYCAGAFMPMFDLRGHRFDNTAYAANIGFVGRFIPRCDDSFRKILGVNAYYDWRQSCLGYFQQWGAGLEVLGKRWDVRGNVYIPFGPKRHTKCFFFDDYVGDYFYREETFESVSYAFNAEVGCYLFYGHEFSLYLAGGPYYIAGRKHHMNKTRGGELRLRPQYKDYLSVEISVRNDSLFHTIWQGEITVNLPLYRVKNREGRLCGLTDWQIYQPTGRFEVMPVGYRKCYSSNF